MLPQGLGPKMPTPDFQSVMVPLPRVFTPELYQQKCDLVYQHVYDSYAGEGKSVYGAAAGG
jgi:hypothetical protein